MRALVYANNTLHLDHNYPPPAPVPGEALVRTRAIGLYTAVSIGGDSLPWI